jgi:threonylcarbamoyladenosine tRNA methylthiotransferase MtaB
MAQTTLPDTAANRVITFGCRLNIYESEIIRRHADAAGLADTVIVNTCAVTAEAERQARQAIRRARRDSPQARIIVTGCAAQIDPERWAALPEVDRVVGNIEKLDAQTFLPHDHEPVRVNDIMATRETANHLIEGFDGHTRAFIQIQNGCDHRCTFCIIPFGRGNSRSVPLGEIARQAGQLVDNGYREIVLTGVNITSYGPDLPGQPALSQMIRRLLAAVPGIARLRLSSLDPADIDADLLRLIADEPRLMPHFHLSLQAGDDLVLKRMKRRHSRAQAIACIDAIRDRRPDAVFGADLITGFPTESETMFANTADLIEEAGLVWLHIFPYSPRPGTPAARMPQAGRQIARERAALLRSAGDRQVDTFLHAEIGGIRDVLIEKNGYGRTPQYAPIRVAGPVVQGAIVPVAITGMAGSALQGKAAIQVPA